MSQRVSGYKRKKNDAYFTPAWCTEALLPHLCIDRRARIHEPADGNGAISTVLRANGFRVTTDDITRGKNFLDMKRCIANAIITNPPYGLAEDFIARAIDLMQPQKGVVAMLLRCDYDHAATRSYLFEHPFAKRLVLRKRIRWIVNSTGSPSYNHSWWIWDWQHDGPPTIGYAP